jgi:ketosteroid isomerase-like protein
VARLMGVIAGALLLHTGACRPTVDVAAATKALLETDRAWAALADANGPVDSVVAYWTPDARVILTGQPILVGTAAIRDMVAGTRAIPGFHIAWTPDSAVVSPGGDFGYTYGVNRITAPDSSGVLRTTEGRYITVWRKEPNGPWRCVIDISNEGPRPAALSAPPR